MPENKNLIILLLSLFVVAVFVSACGSSDSAPQEQAKEAKAVEEANEETNREDDEEAHVDDMEEAEESHEEDGDEAKESAASGGLSELKIAMLTSGPINDDGWNQTAYDGLVALEQAGAEIANTENVAQADQLDLLRSYGDQGFDVIVGHGFEYGDALLAAAEEYPEVSFIQIGGIADNGKNIASYVFVPGEGGYIAGILAGHMSPTGKIGGIGAIEIPAIAADFTGFTQAAKTINPNIGNVPVAYTGSWVDIPKAKEAAIAQIDSGIDLILADGDNANIGAIEAAAENGSVYAIGWTRDQSHLGTDVVLTSVLQRVDNILTGAILDIQEGDITWGNHVVGFADGAQSLAPFHPDVPTEVAEEVQATLKAMIDGKIVLDNEGNVVKDEYHQ